MAASVPTHGRGWAHRTAADKTRSLGVDFQASRRAYGTDLQAKRVAAKRLQRLIGIVSSLDQLAAQAQ